MKPLSLIIFIIFLNGCSSGYETTVECYSTTQFRKFSTPSFTSYIMNVKSGDQSRVDIYIQMPYRNIRFEKSVDGFKASYSLTFIIRDEKKEIVQTKEVDRPILARTYEETVSSRFDFHLQPFLLVPNFYTIEIAATDNLSQLRYRQTEKFSAGNYSDSSCTASSILFLNTMLIDEKGISLRPILPTSLSLLSDSVGMFQELYNIRSNDTVRIREKYRLPHAEEKTEGSFFYGAPPYRVTGTSCEKAFDSVYYQKDSVFVAQRNGTIQLFQFYPLPCVGGSNIERTIFVRRDGKADSLVYFNEVFRRNKRFLTLLSNGEVISAMQYIMHEQEYDSLISARSEDQNIWINKFWENRGGIERLKEFERKIAEANALFTTCEDGSRTAMGIVYIVCGTPDYIDCRGKYIESWFYNLGERAYPFEFRRVSEHKQLYALTPFSVDESVWQYFVDRWRRGK